MHGWNKRNIMTMLEFFGRRELRPGKRALARLPGERAIEIRTFSSIAAAMPE